MAIIILNTVKIIPTYAKVLDIHNYLSAGLEFELASTSFILCNIKLATRSSDMFMFAK